MFETTTGLFVCQSSNFHFGHLLETIPGSKHTIWGKIRHVTRRARSNHAQTPRNQKNRSGIGIDMHFNDLFDGSWLHRLI